MQTHQERVVVERADLSHRLGKLEEFLTTELFRSLPQEERARMVRQQAAMCEYRAVLDERIAAFTPGTN